MSDSGMDSPAPDPVEVLERWHQSGAEWQVLTRSSSQVTVALYRCDGVEEDRLVSSDPALLSFLAGRTSSTA
jgi:hypothetical protein